MSESMTPKTDLVLTYVQDVVERYQGDVAKVVADMLRHMEGATSEGVRRAIIWSADDAVKTSWIAAQVKPALEILERQGNAAEVLDCLQRLEAHHRIEQMRWSSSKTTDAYIRVYEASVAEARICLIEKVLEMRLWLQGAITEDSPEGLRGRIKEAAAEAKAIIEDVAASEKVPAGACSEGLLAAATLDCLVTGERLSDLPYAKNQVASARVDAAALLAWKGPKRVGEKQRAIATRLGEIAAHLALLQCQVEAIEK